MLSIDLLPKTKEEKEKCASDWSNISGSFGITHGHLAPIDGWLCTTEMPSDVPNQLDYRSGHYQRYGLNIQAMCDANLRIIYFAVAGPGKMNDARAFRRLIGLRRWIDDLDEGYYISGDNAYPLSNNLLIPYSGSEKHEMYKDVYNFYLSQLRIRIEMCFGRLTTKWRIFRSDLTFSTPQNSLIARVGARLHNYVINADRLNFVNTESDNLMELEIEPLIDGPTGNMGYLPVRYTGAVNSFVENGEHRELKLQMIRERDMERPQHNVDRNG